MSSTVYICYVKWSETAKQRGPDYFFKTWMKRHGEVCEKYDVSLMKWGLPMGTQEDHVFIYESSIDVHGFMEFKGEISRIKDEKLWDYSKTNIIVCPEN